MSSFHHREFGPREGDIGAHSKYGEVELIGEISVSGHFYYGYWLVKDIDNDELRIVNIKELEDLGWYGE